LFDGIRHYPIHANGGQNQCGRRKCRDQQGLKSRTCHRLRHDVGHRRRIEVYSKARIELPHNAADCGRQCAGFGGGPYDEVGANRRGERGVSQVYVVLWLGVGMKTRVPDVLRDSHDFIEAGFPSHDATKRRLPPKVAPGKLSIHDDRFGSLAAVTVRQRSSFKQANAHRVEVSTADDAHHHRVAGSGRNRQAGNRQPKRAAARDR
jgi:hypothetical protein